MILMGGSEKKTNDRKDEKEVGEEAKKPGGGQKVEVFIVGFVVEKISFGGEVVSLGANPVVGVAKRFHSGTKKRPLYSELESSFPDNTANGHGVRTADPSFVFFGDDGEGVGVERVDFVERA